MVILTNAPWIKKWDLVAAVRQLGLKATELSAVYPDAFDPLTHYKVPVKRIRITDGKRKDPLDLSGKRARRAAEEHSALGGLRDAAVSITKLAGWTNVWGPAQRSFGLRFTATLHRA